MPDSPNETPAMIAAGNERIAWINQSVANFASSIALISGELHAEAVSALNNLTPETAAKAKALVDLQTALQKQLNKLDYPGKIQSFIGQFDDAQKGAIAMLKAMELPTERLAPLDDRALQNLKRMDYKFLADLGPAAVQAVSQGVIRNTLMGMPRARMIQQIQATLNGKFKNYAVTYADTALSAYDRRATMAIWAEAGLDKFTYRGPRDIKNRVFCATHVGKVYTRAEINRMNNGTALMPVLVYGGGWNCRHIWTPVPQQPLERKPPGSATEAEPGQSEALQDALAKFAHESARTVVKLAKQQALKSWTDESAAAVQKLNAEAAAKKAALEKALSAFADESAAKVAELNKAAEEAKKLAAKIAAEKAAKEAAEKAAAEAAAKAAAEAAAKKAAEAAAAAAAAKKAAEDAALQAALKLVNAQNPTQLIEKGTDAATGKPTFTVQGKTYASSGAAWNFAKKLFDAAHPEAAQAAAAAKAAKNAPAPAPAPTPASAAAKPTAPAAAQTAAAPEGMQAAYTMPGPFKKPIIYSYDPASGNYLSSDGVTAAPQKVADWAKKGFLQPTSSTQVDAATTPVVTTPVVPPTTPVEDLAASAAKAAGFGAQFTFEKQADVGGAHYKEFYTDAKGNRWLFKPISNPNDRFLVYADEAAFKIGKAIKGDVVEVRAAEINGKFGSIQKMQTDLATKPDFTAGPYGNEPVPMKTLTASQISQLQSEQVVDWLISNHDAHPKQFVQTATGTVYGIDKTQAWKFFGKDKLSPTYHPNTVEVEPIYNPLMRAAKAGEIKLDPAAALKAIKAAEGISDAELISYVKPYAESRWKTDAEARQKFYDGLVARKNNLRSDFEKLYADVLNQPGFEFEPKEKPSARSRQAKAGKIPAASADGYLDAPNLERVAAAEKTGWQGITLTIDKGDIEDQNVLLWAEKLPGGKDRTVLKFKLRPEAQKKVLDAMGVKNLATSAASVSSAGSLSLLNQMYELVPKPAVVTSKQIFEKLIQGHPVTNWQFGWGGKMTPQQIASVKKEADAYLKKYEKAKREAYRAEKAAPAAEPSARDYEVKQVDFTIDQKAVRKGAIHVEAQDLPFGNVMSVYGTLPQVNATWKDGMEARFVPWKDGSETAYAHQGTFEIRMTGKPDAATIEKALQRLDSMGISGRAATAIDTEKMYLEKQAYVTKVHTEPEWKQLQRDTASATDEVKVERMRQFWSRRLGVKDVTALPYYKPEGEYQLQWNDPTRRAGQRLQYRFDLDPAKFAQDMKSHRLFHSVTYGGSTMEKFLPAMLDNNGSLVATTEKLRAGVVKGGASASSDMGTGGANYVFTRIKSATATAAGLYFKTDGLRRMDAISYESDMFGRTTGKTPEEHRATTAMQMKDYSRYGSNETILKYNINVLEQLDFIKAENEMERRRILDIFKARGITKLPDGRSISSVVK